MPCMDTTMKIDGMFRSALSIHNLPYNDTPGFPTLAGPLTTIAAIFNGEINQSAIRTGWNISRYRCFGEKFIFGLFSRCAHSFQLRRVISPSPLSKNSNKLKRSWYSNSSWLILRKPCAVEPVRACDGQNPSKIQPNRRALRNNKLERRKTNTLAWNCQTTKKQCWTILTA